MNTWNCILVLILITYENRFLTFISFVTRILETYFVYIIFISKCILINVSDINWSLLCWPLVIKNIGIRIIVLLCLVLINILPLATLRTPWKLKKTRDLLMFSCGSERGTAQKRRFSIKDFLSKCNDIHSFLLIYSHLLKKSLMENFIFYSLRLVAWNGLNTLYLR